MVYKQQYFTWIGHSVNDAPAPSAVTYPGYFRYDTDTFIFYYSDGTNWIVSTTGPTAIAELKNKTFDFTQNHPIKFSRIGAYAPTTSMSTPNDVWGILRGMVSVGVPFAKNLGGLGTYHRYATYGTIADDVAGVLKLDGWLTWRSRNPLIRFGIRFNANTSNNRRMFVGYGAQRMLTTNTDTLPLGNSEHGFLFGHGTGDTQFQIFHNDGTGSCQKTTTGINLPGIATNYILEITCNDTAGSFTSTLYSVLAGGNRGSVLGTPTTISSRIPGSLIGLYMQNLVMGSTTTQQFNEPYFIEVYAV
jgi:hypothetical protein